MFNLVWCGKERYYGWSNSLQAGPLRLFTSGEWAADTGFWDTESGGSSGGTGERAADSGFGGTGSGGNSEGTVC